jgi:hypothetical protein
MAGGSLGLLALSFLTIATHHDARQLLDSAKHSHG